MVLSLLDWIIVGCYFVVSLLIGLYLAKRASSTTTEFFLSGRKLPWYIAGTSMVATTFAADTPLAITELVAKHGISGNWLWWNMIFGGMLTVFFFAKLWRRAGILTDAEFVSIRYSGATAHFLRGFRAVYIGIFMNAIVIGWVNVAMLKILTVLFPNLTFFGLEQINVLGIAFSSHLLWVAMIMLFTAVYSSLSGLWGVSFTDTFQFIMAMGGSIILAIFAVNEIGGIDEMKTQLADRAWLFDFFPAIDRSATTSHQSIETLKLGIVAFVAYLGVQWWASWYPGAEPGGGGYVAQRMMSAKNERHSLLATLWFQIAHFAIRPWPWILVAIVALMMYPSEADKGATYVMMIRDLMPHGLLGLLFAAFLAAYMSTLASQTVWGTSYIINDLYKPFIKPNATERYYVRISRITTFVLIIFSLIVTTQMDNISDAWKFILAASGGIGLVLILRWYWWRINAWSEISAMLAPYILLPILIWGFDYSISDDFEYILIYVVLWSTSVWLVVTFFTPHTKLEQLKFFYKRVHPGGRGWQKISKLLPEVISDSGYKYSFLLWIFGSVMVMSALIGFGKLLLHDFMESVTYFGVLVISGFIVIRTMTLNRV